MSLAQSPASLVISRSGGAAARLGEPVDTVLTVRNAGNRRMRARCVTRGRPARWPSLAAIR